VAAPAAPAAPPAPEATDLEAPPAVAEAALAPEPPEAPEAPFALFAGDVPEPPVAPAPPQEPAPPAAPTTLYVSGNYLGVRTEEVTRENMQRYGLTGEPRGVGVKEVVKDSPAEKAGLKVNDVIVRFDGEPVTSVRKLTRLIGEAAPEHTARLTVLRAGSEQELSATLKRRGPFLSPAGASVLNLPEDILGDAQRMADEAVRNTEQWRRMQERAQRQWDEAARRYPGVFGPSRRIGVTTSALGKQLADYFGVTHGVLVSSVEEGSPAEKAGLKAGDVVTEADGRKVEDSDDLIRAVSAKEEGEVTLTVVRDRKPRTVRVTPERRPAPRGLLTPGTIRLLDSPVAAFDFPGIRMHPEVWAGPRAVVTPRVTPAPRARAYGLGEGVQ
jgi:serine protease Do